ASLLIDFWLPPRLPTIAMHLACAGPRKTPPLYVRPTMMHRRGSVAPQVGGHRVGGSHPDRMLGQELELLGNQGRAMGPDSLGESLGPRPAARRPGRDAVSPDPCRHRQPAGPADGQLFNKSLVPPP